MAQVPIEETTEQAPAKPTKRAGNSQQARRRPRTAPTAPQDPAPAPAGQAPQGDSAALVEALRQVVKDQAEALADPGVDEGTGVEFVKTGWIRLPAADPDKVWRLRAPLFGELRDLRTAHETMFDQTEQLKLRAAEAEAVAAGVEDEASRQLEPQRSRMRAEAGLTYRKVLREVQEAQETARVEWWLQVLEVLCVENGHPTSLDDALPAWMAAPELPVKVVHHWRSVPLAPGR